MEGRLTKIINVWIHTFHKWLTLAEAQILRELIRGKYWSGRFLLRCLVFSRYINTNINVLYLRDVISTESNVVVAFERFQAMLKLFWFYSKADAWLCFCALASHPEPILCWIAASGFMQLAHRISVCFFPELWWMGDTTRAQMENGVKPRSGWQIGGIQGQSELRIVYIVYVGKRRVGLCSFRSSGPSCIDWLNGIALCWSVIMTASACSCFSGNGPKIKTFTIILLRTTMKEEDVAHRHWVIPLTLSLTCSPSIHTHRNLLQCVYTSYSWNCAGSVQTPEIQQGVCFRKKSLDTFHIVFQPCFIICCLTVSVWLPGAWQEVHY